MLVNTLLRFLRMRVTIRIVAFVEYFLHLPKNSHISRSKLRTDSTAMFLLNRRGRLQNFPRQPVVLRPGPFPRQPIVLRPGPYSRSSIDLRPGPNAHNTNSPARDQASDQGADSTPQQPAASTPDSNASLRRRLFGSSEPDPQRQELPAYGPIRRGNGFDRYFPPHL